MLFEIYNGFNNCIYDDLPTIEAKTSREAVLKLLIQENIEFTNIKCSGSRYVKIKTTPFKYNEEGRKSRLGKDIWWEVNK